MPICGTFVMYHEQKHFLHKNHTIIKLDQSELKTFPIFSCYFRVVFFRSTLHASMIIKQKQINRQSLTNPFFFSQKSYLCFSSLSNIRKGYEMVCLQKIYLILQLLILFHRLQLNTKENVVTTCCFLQCKKLDFTIKSRLNISRKYFIHDVFILCKTYFLMFDSNFSAKS